MGLEHRRTEIDTELHPTFPVLSAGNFAEVAPERLSIISWSLLGDPVEASLRDLAARFWPRARWYTGSHYVFVGYVACRPYHNLSALCHMARQIPGLRPGDVTSSYFQDQPEPDGVPGLHPRLSERVVAVPRLLREVFTLGSRIGLLEGCVATAEARARRVLDKGSEAQLGVAFEQACATVRNAWGLHYLSTVLLVPLRRLVGVVGRTLTSHWSEIEPWVGQPDEVVWHSLHDLRDIGQSLGPAEFLDRAFYEVADDHEPWRGYRRRGDATDTSVMHVQTAAPAAARRRAGSVWPANRKLWDIEPTLRRRGMPVLVELFTNMLQYRELTKSLAMRSMHVCRRLLPMVARSVGVADDAWPYLRVKELTGYHSPEALAARADRRRRACAEALRQEAPETLGEPRSTAPAVGGPVVRSGRGVSPGLVIGVVVDRPNAAAAMAGQTRILVCESADAEIEPHLPNLGGVITARGSALSHLSIIAREHGTPAVVGHPLARTLRPGQVVSMNGTTGEVHTID